MLHNNYVLWNAQRCAGPLFRSYIYINILTAAVEITMKLGTVVPYKVRKLWLQCKGSVCCLHNIQIQNKIQDTDYHHSPASPKSS